MNLSDIGKLVDRQWDEDIVPRLVDYVKIPAKSPAFDANWAAHGELAAVVQAAHRWAETRPIAGLALEIVALPGKTPCLLFDAPATGGLGAERTVLFYGHLDKQPEMAGWRADLGPYKPVIENGRLYGRGSADDGYALYAALAAIHAIDAQGSPRPRCVGLIETCEESGSPDLPDYLEALKARFGDVQLVCGLDSGCGNYEQLWLTTSLRGLAGGTLTVEILEEGVHSGMASGIVPSSFRIARKLLNRIDDVDTGTVLIPELSTTIPPERIAQAKLAGSILGEEVWRQFPWAGCDHGPTAHPGAVHQHAMPVTTDPVEAILNRTWRPALAVTGAANLPGLGDAGNVLRPKTSLKLSLRLPPTIDAAMASARIKAVLEQDPPYGARISFSADHAANGWNAPPTAPWLLKSLESASLAAFGKPLAFIGEGGTIPFMDMLGTHFPRAQFMITGVLGPHSNAHGPNEFLDIGYGKRLTAAVAGVVASMP